MFYLASFCLLWVLVGLLHSGCATSSHSASLSPDWHEHEVTIETNLHPVVVAPQPILAPPPTNPPLATSQPANQSPVIQPNETWVPVQRWVKAEPTFSLNRLSSGPQPIYQLRGPGGGFLLHAGSQLAQWNGLEVRLGFAPQMIDGQMYVHALDLRKTLEPLLKGIPELYLGSNPVMVIDPGHGGSDSGTKSIYDGHYEKEFTLDWAMRLQGLLATNGWRVFLTRSTDAEVSLSNRVAFAELHKATVFLSLHFNSAAPNQTEAGLETYCLTPVGMPSSLTRGFADDATLKFPNNAFDAQNLELALQVHHALLNLNGIHDRGVRRARFPAVLRWQQRPSILIEGGYLSNPHEAALISSPAHRQKLAEAVAAALNAQLARDHQRAPAILAQTPAVHPVSTALLAPPPSQHSNRRTSPSLPSTRDSEEDSHNPEIQ